MLYQETYIVELQYGTNELIKQGAKLVNNETDILEDFLEFYQ